MATNTDNTDTPTAAANDAAETPAAQSNGAGTPGGAANDPGFFDQNLFETPVSVTDLVGILLILLIIFVCYKIYHAVWKQDDVTADAQPAGNGNFRDLLAENIVRLSIVALLGVSLIVVAIGILAAEGEEAVENSQYVFAALLPLFGTWIGTVLAYYFSKQNFEAASKATESLVKMSVQKLRSVSIEEAMIPLGSIVGIVKAPNDKLRDVPLQKVAEAMEKTLPSGRPISRVVILAANNACIGIIHRSIWSEMRAVVATSGATVNFKNEAANTDTLDKVHDLESETRAPEKFGNFITHSIAFARAGATLADAKMRMESRDDCQDVFITANGSAAEPIIGWVTNQEISKALEA
ncbi:hypothetical protein [Roseibium sp. MMSF_3412]|uniref:hypothetical protein n=1 Tax=Roseibium sp. MMSF_3412 TaxID=3046712 RepID=UPI00273E2797|nr:hypothetical protein [Roseibium sp. MMSF_3412]